MQRTAARCNALRTLQHTWRFTIRAKYLAPVSACLAIYMSVYMCYVNKCLYIRVTWTRLCISVLYEWVIEHTRTSHVTDINTSRIARYKSVYIYVFWIYICVTRVSLRIYLFSYKYVMYRWIQICIYICVTSVSLCIYLFRYKYVIYRRIQICVYMCYQSESVYVFGWVWVSV